MCGLVPFEAPGGVQMVFVASGCDLPINNLALLPLAREQELDAPSGNCTSQLSSAACLALRDAPQVCHAAM